MDANVAEENQSKYDGALRLRSDEEARPCEQARPCELATYYWLHFKSFMLSGFLLFLHYIFPAFSMFTLFLYYFLNQKKCI